MNGPSHCGGSCPVHGTYVGRFCSWCAIAPEEAPAIAWPPLMAPATSSNWPANGAASSAELRVAAPALTAELLELARESAA